MVRGNIMNAMRPLQRDGLVIGYVFVNELTDDVRAQVAAMDSSISLSVMVGVIVSLLLIVGLTEGMMRDVQSVIYGVKELKFDLRRRITGLRGEMGEVAATINE
ncbi:MAG TPA: two-component system sensor histidine kinase AtoS, partial [Sporomusaceae bacterium]|nr:two-component system sensor histidine kinase AtoS [Sporomusaceae bacterium]